MRRTAKVALALPTGPVFISPSGEILNDMTPLKALFVVMRLAEAVPADGIVFDEGLTSTVTVRSFLTYSRPRRLLCQGLEIPGARFQRAGGVTRRAGTAYSRGRRGRGGTGGGGDEWQAAY